MEHDLAAALKHNFSVELVAKPEAQVKPYPTYEVPASKLADVAKWLRDEEGYAYLDMVTAVDWKGPTQPTGYIEEPNPNPYVPKGAYAQEKMVPKANPKVEYKDAFRATYLFSNLDKKSKLALKVETSRAEPSLPSLTGLFKTADWQEREVYDMLGVKFEGHPNLKKILTPDFIQGHPLRKDYVHQKDQYD